MILPLLGDDLKYTLDHADRVDGPQAVIYARHTGRQMNSLNSHRHFLARTKISAPAAALCDCNWTAWKPGTPAGAGPVPCTALLSQVAPRRMPPGGRRPATPRDAGTRTERRGGSSPVSAIRPMPGNRINRHPGNAWPHDHTAGRPGPLFPPGSEHRRPSGARHEPRAAPLPPPNEQPERKRSTTAGPGQERALLSNKAGLRRKPRRQRLRSSA
jgi:hypothetical protein